MVAERKGPVNRERRTRPTQTERSTAMRERLAQATIASLIDKGYAGTTAVEVCARAGVTRGAFHHHFPSLAALFKDALQRLYVRLAGPPPQPDGGTTSLEQFVRRAWHHTKAREFKAIIEIWLAARNDPTLGKELARAIERLSRLFHPGYNPRLASRLGKSAKAATFYRLVAEAMIGMALGRAVSPQHRPLEHEASVVDLLASLAKTI